MKKYILKIIFFITLSFSFFSSCTKKKENIGEELPSVKSHAWYFFTDSGFKKIDLPKNAPLVFEKPWTEAVRISCAASAVPAKNGKTPYSSYALVNKMGLLCFNDEKIDLFCDASLFSSDTQDSLVFSNGKPVFYLYQSTFFNPNINKKNEMQRERTFLVMFSSEQNLFFPLVSYANLGLEETSQITGYFWDGKTWACSSKKLNGNGVEFSYFYWEPLIPLTELSPALGQAPFLFKPLEEEKYKEMNLPRLFDFAPEELKSLLSSIPDGFSFYVSWRDDSGTTPVSYYRFGSDNSPMSAKAGLSYPEKYSVAVFSDGTVYIKKIGENNTTLAFRLPLLPAGFSYGEEAISGDTLYVAWEESSFFKTARAGFISVKLDEILDQ